MEQNSAQFTEIFNREICRKIRRPISSEQSLVTLMEPELWEYSIHNYISNRALNLYTSSMPVDSFVI